MATMKDVVEGMKILMQYDSIGWVEAQHDMIVAAPRVKEKDLEPEDVKKMEGLGWHFSEEAGSWALYV